MTRKSSSCHVAKIILSKILGEGTKTTGPEKSFQKLKIKNANSFDLEMRINFCFKLCIVKTNL